MRGAGFNNNNSDINTLFYVWKVAIRPVLTHCCNSMYISKKSLSNMEKLQTKLLKASAGLHKYCKLGTPVLKALNANTIDTTVEISSLDLMGTIFCNASRPRSFYSHLLKMHVRGKLVGHTDLIARVNTICFKQETSLKKFLLINVMPTK